MVAARRKQRDELTPAEGWKLFDATARRCAGMSGEEFVRRWDAGELGTVADVDGTPLMDVVMALPFARAR